VYTIENVDLAPSIIVALHRSPGTEEFVYSDSFFHFGPIEYPILINREMAGSIIVSLFLLTPLVWIRRGICMKICLLPSPLDLPVAKSSILSANNPDSPTQLSLLLCDS